MSKNRGAAPNEKVLRMLCGKSAGMCQFEGCNERLFYDEVTTKNFIDCNVAHIIASSPNGVRGDSDLSHKLSDKLENLMLMCYRHHKLIDDPQTGANDYPVEKLKEMKKSHEEQINKVCSYFNLPKTELFFFTSPIRGKSVSIDINLASKAVLPLKKPETPYGQNKNIKSSFQYGSSEYQNDICMQLNNIMGDINSIKSVRPQIHFSMFALAPMPVLAKLGELISDKIPIDIYQKTRVPDTWEWLSNEATNSFDVNIFKRSKGNTITIILELTAEISLDRIESVTSSDSIIKISAQNKGVDSVKSIEDLKLFWQTYQKVLDEITNTYSKNCDLKLFMAVPVSAAFEVGRRFMQDIYPTIQIYDDTETGFKRILTLGGQAND